MTKIKDLSKTHISISSLTPKNCSENLISVVEMFEKKVIEFEQEFDKKECARIMKLIVEFGLMDCKEWEKDLKNIKIVNMLILAKTYFIRLNNIFHKIVNNIDCGTIYDQIKTDEEIKKYLPFIILTP